MNTNWFDEARYGMFIHWGGVFGGRTEKTSFWIPGEPAT